MLIRSQDKKTVVNTGDLTMFVCKKNGNCHCICTERCEELGRYKTEERAMEVLHLIAKQSAQCKVVEILCGPVHEGQTQSIALLLAEEIEKMWYTDMPEE